MRRMIIKSIVLASITSVVCAQPALAYIDPNAGGVLFQVLAILLASFSAILLVFRARFAWPSLESSVFCTVC
jgi:hypothetical protein